MIFTEQDLNIGANAYNIINESVSIESDKLISPNTISLIESGSIGGYVVRFNDVEELSEAYGIDYIDSMLAIAEVNGIDPQYLAVAVNEADIIMNPDLIYELANVVTVPISENSMAYQFCEACIDGYAYTGDESYIELLVEGSTTQTFTMEFDDDDLNNYNSSDKSGITFTTKNGLKNKDSKRGIIRKIEDLVHDARMKGADWIGKKIASLNKMLEKYEAAEKDGKGGIWNTTKEKVVKAIRWALEKLQQLLTPSATATFLRQNDMVTVGWRKRDAFRNKESQQ